MRGRWKQQFQALHMSVFPTVGWGAGCRHWTSTELRQPRSVQLRMTRRVLGWWPKQGEDWPIYARRKARRRLPPQHRHVSHYGTRQWPLSGGDGPGHLARFETHPDDRICIKLVQWKGVWWRKTLRNLLDPPHDQDRRRLGWGHRTLGKRRWDEPLQNRVDARTNGDVHWNEPAQDTEAWARPEPTFVAHLLRRSPNPATSHGIREAIGISLNSTSRSRANYQHTNQQ